MKGIRIDIRLRDVNDTDEDIFLRYERERVANRILKVTDGGRAKRSRRAIIAILGERCNHCGFSDLRALQVDHVNGDGWKERRTSAKAGEVIGLNYYHILVKVISGSKNYQILCANCNWIKRHENGEY